MEENKNLDKTGTSFEDNGDISMADLVKGYDESSNIGFGKEIEATIIEENSDGFMVDLGMKSEGIIPKKEFEEGKVPTELKVGASVKVKIVSLHDQPVLSYREIVEEAKWGVAQKSFENGKHVNGTILKTIKGGFLVNVDGINAFLPISQLDTHFVKEAERYVGKSYEFVIIELDGRKKI